MDNIRIDNSKWITQQALADDLGISIQRVHNWIKRGNVEAKVIPELRITLVNRNSVTVKTIN